MAINDIVRLGALLTPARLDVKYLSTLPRIIAPTFYFPERDAAAPGRLVVVDTPGPDEEIENLELFPVVEAELERSSVVMVVFDVTKMKDKAAAEVRRRIDKIVEMRGKDDLYAVVNKIDQRKHAAMTSEQVKETIRTLPSISFGKIGVDRAKRRVIEGVRLQRTQSTSHGRHHSARKQHQWGPQATPAQAA